MVTSSTTQQVLDSVRSVHIGEIMSIAKETDRKLELRSRVLEITELAWGFDADAPRILPIKRTGYTYGEKVDPFPCYVHDTELVVETANSCELLFPVSFPPYYYLSHYESLGRTNGQAHNDSVYEGGTGKVVGHSAYIYLWGKRIPPHPAMTRYLVAHEYGHIVQDQIEANRKVDTHQSINSLEKQYMELRPGSNKEYGSRKWHGNVGELIANDFRILICGIEEEFWPHPGFPHPHKVPEVQKFWEEAVAENIQGLKCSESEK